MSIYAPSDAPCGIYGPGACGGGTHRLIAFVRPAHLVPGGIPSQDPAGEVLVSFVPIGSVSLDWQPRGAGLLRQIQGVVVQLAAVAIGGPGVDIQELDRCVLQGKQLECTDVLDYGDHKEFEFRDVGR